MNPFVFIVGCARSGTTLLQRLMDAHPQIAVINQSRWITRYLKKRTLLTPDGRMTPKLISKVLANDRFHRLGVSQEEVERLSRTAEAMSYAHFVSGVFDLYGQARGKPLVGDKTPRYVRNIGALAELWPQAKFVHLIRDGRDVGLSTVNWKKKAAKLARRFTTWHEHPLITAAVRWRWNVRLGQEAGAPLGTGVYYELRYEALVARPAEECAKLCAFLGVPYGEAMLRFHEGRTRSEPGLSTKDAWLPITPGLRNWRTQMSAEDLECFEAVTGDLLDELGYPRGAGRLQPKTLEHAARVRDLFTSDARSRGRALPARW
jgi:hypothetical protein